MRSSQNNSSAPRRRLGAKIWGCRGSVPHCGQDQAACGGNTSCIEILHDGLQRIIIDAGTGLANAGGIFPTDATQQDRIHLLFTHYHLDHTCGLPFFPPIYVPGFPISFHGMNGDQGELERAVQLCFDPRFSPIYTPDNLASDYRYEVGTDGFRIDNVNVTTWNIDGLHPGGIGVLRITQGHQSIVVATDIGIQDRAHRDGLGHAWDNADIVLADCQYSDEECKKRKGWGHSSYKKCAGVARWSGVKRLIGFHHDPFKSDSEIMELRDEAAHEYSELTVDVALEGSTYWC
jgi:phosphoribosyl 1,2-cyclic phosphodiesterase